MTSMTSKVKMAALAAACALGIAGTMFYHHQAVAQTARPTLRNQPALAHMAPGQSVEMIAPLATITSTVHYQAQLGLDCSGGSFCTGDFPKVRTNRQLNITRISCRLIGSVGSTFSDGFINLYNSSNGFVLSEFLPVDFSSSQIHVLNRAVDLQIAAHQHMFVSLSPDSGTASFGDCTATGTLSTLG